MKRKGITKVRDGSKTRDFLYNTGKLEKSLLPNILAGEKVVKDKGDRSYEKVGQPHLGTNFIQPDYFPDLLLTSQVSNTDFGESSKKNHPTEEDNQESSHSAVTGHWSVELLFFAC